MPFERSSLRCINIRGPETVKFGPTSYANSTVPDKTSGTPTFIRNSSVHAFALLLQSQMKPLRYLCHRRPSWFPSFRRFHRKKIREY